MKTLIKNLVIIIAILAMIGCIKETTTYPMGDNKHTIKVRGQGALTTDEEMKTAWYEKAGIVCPSGYDVESIETKDQSNAESTRLILEGAIVCK